MRGATPPRNSKRGRRRSSAVRRRGIYSRVAPQEKGRPDQRRAALLRYNHSVTPDSFRGPPYREANTIGIAAPWMPDQVRHDEGVPYAVTASAFGLIFPVAIAVSLSSVAYSSSSVSLRIAAISGRPSWFAQAIIVP